MLHYLKDVIVSDLGLILDRNFSMIPDVNSQYEFWINLVNLRLPWWDHNPLYEEYVRKIPLKPIRHLQSDIYVYALSFHREYLYGHLWDSIQPLKIVEDSGIQGNLLYNIDSEINDINQHWDIFGYPVGRRTAIDAKVQNYRVSKLVVPIMDNFHGFPANRIVPHTKDWLIEKYMSWDEVELNNSPRKLYLSRHQAASRNVVNEEEVTSFLEGRGFTIVRGSEPLKDHINLFNSAKVIVGCHGSLFKNILFCRNRPTIIEFYPNSREDKCFVWQNETCDITDDYRFVPVESQEWAIHLNIKMLESLNL